MSGEQLRVKLGTRITARSAFHNGDTDQAEDPATAELRINPPNGPTFSVASTDPDVEHPSVGEFVYHHLPTVPGRWIYAWVGISPPSGVNAVDEQQVYVEGRAVD